MFLADFLLPGSETDPDQAGNETNPNGNTGVLSVDMML